MEYELTAEQKEFVQMCIAQGRYSSVEEAVNSALELFVERERRRMELLAELSIGDEAIRKGEYSELNRSTLSQIVDEITENAQSRIIVPLVCESN